MATVENHRFRGHGSHRSFHPFDAVWLPAGYAISGTLLFDHKIMTITPDSCWPQQPVPSPAVGGHAGPRCWGEWWVPSSNARSCCALSMHLLLLLFVSYFVLVPCHHATKYILCITKQINKHTAHQLVLSRITHDDQPRPNI